MVLPRWPSNVQPVTGPPTSIARASDVLPVPYWRWNVMGPREFHDFIPGTVIRFSYLFNSHLLEGLSAGPSGYRGWGGGDQTIPGDLGHTPKTQLCSRDHGASGSNPGLGICWYNPNHFASFLASKPFSLSSCGKGL